MQNMHRLLQHFLNHDYPYVVYQREFTNGFIYSQVLTGLPYAYAFDGRVFAEFCVLPPTDPSSNAPKEALSRGITSTSKWSEIDSLI